MKKTPAHRLFQHLFGPGRGTADVLADQLVAGDRDARA